MNESYGELCVGTEDGVEIKAVRGDDSIRKTGNRLPTRRVRRVHESYGASSRHRRTEVARKRITEGIDRMS